MNKFYRVVWCFVKKAYVVCSELGKQRKKNAKSALVATALVFSLVMPAAYAEQSSLIWTGGVSQDFLETDNWEDNNVPPILVDKDKFLGNDFSNVDFIFDSKNVPPNKLDSDGRLHVSLNGEDKNNVPLPIHITNNNIDIGDKTTLTFTATSQDNPSTSESLYQFKTNINVGGKDADHIARLYLNSRQYNWNTTPKSITNPIHIRNLNVGTEGTHAEVIADGGIVIVESFLSDTPDNPLPNPYLIIGDGANSHGTVSVLNGGKFASTPIVPNYQHGVQVKAHTINLGLLHSQDPNISITNPNRETIISALSSPDGSTLLGDGIGHSIIGQNGGTGILNVIGKGTLADTKDSSSMVLLTDGNSVGVGQGSSGSIAITDGAELFASGLSRMTTTSPQISQEVLDNIATTSAMRLGVDGGYGTLDITGQDSHAYIGGINSGKSTIENGFASAALFLEDTTTGATIGEFNIGSSGIGELTLKDGGNASVGYFYSKDTYDSENSPNVPYNTATTQHVTFTPGKAIDSAGNIIETSPDIYGKTVLAADTKDAIGIINFGENLERDANGHIIVKPNNHSAGTLNTSDLSVGLGRGILNFNHNGTDDNPFVFDINTHETKNSNYHFGDNAEEVGQISVNIVSGTTLFHSKKVIDENGIEVYPIGSNVAMNPDDGFFSYSGDTNILGGTLQAKDDNILSLNSDFKTSGSGKLHLINTDQRLKGLYNLGTVQMGDDNLVNQDNKLSLDKANEKTLTVTNDYSGGGEIILNALWGQSGGQTSDFYVDKIMIEGDSLASNPTIVTSRNGHSVTNGSIDALSDFWLSEPFIAIEGTDHNIAQSQSFLGQINAKKEGYASKYSILALTPQINHNQNGDVDEVTYHWTNTVHERGSFANTGQPILPDEASVLAQMPYANIEQGAAALGQYFDRYGTASPCNLGDCDLTEKPAWVRSYGNQQEHEANRFSFKSNLYGIQAGKSVWSGEVGKTQMEAGLMAGYSMNDSTFKDNYRTTWGSAVRVDNKETGTGTSSMFTVGAYNTMALENGVYVDTIAQVSSIQNKYKPKTMAEISQSGTMIGLSFEVGKDISLGQSNWHVTPQAQVTFQNISLSDKDYVDSAGDTMTLKGEKSTFTRARIGAKWQRIVENQPTFYFKTDLWRQFSAFNPMADAEYTGESDNNKYGEMWTDVGIGFNKKINQKLNIRADVSYQQALSGEKRSGFQANAGIRYNW